LKIHDEVYFMMLARVASFKSTCPRLAVGAVLVKDRRVISTGFNGAPSGMKECLIKGCLMYQAPDQERTHCINTIHAEINALTHAKEVGDTLYTTNSPCINCFKALMSHNPNLKIVYLHEYDDPSRDYFIGFHKLENQMVQIQRENEKTMYELMPKAKTRDEH
jgi:dCMP deaminase